MPAPIDAFFEILASEGIDRIFGNPGTTELPLIDALADRDTPEYVLGLQEASVVAMADGYARARRAPSFVSLHVAAGLANGLIGMLNAKRSRTPMVVTAGQQDRRHLIQDPMLAGDLVGLAAAASKASVQVEHAYDLPLQLRRAFALAQQPPAGPVFLSVPMDLLAEDTEIRVPARSPRSAPAPATGLAEAARILAAASNPGIVAGDGVGREGGVAALEALADALAATVYHQPMADAVNFPGNHPLFAGMLTPTNAAVREQLTEHDVVLIVGAHAFSPHHYSAAEPIPERTRAVQLDSDPGEIGRNFAVDLGLVGDVPASLAGITEALGGPVRSAPERRQRLATRLAADRAQRDAQARAAYSDAPVDPLAAAHALAAGLPERAVVVEEAITTGIALRSVLRQDLPGSYVHTVGGGLGWGIGAAIGTRMGNPDRPVVAVLGDGCTTFGMQGLWSAVRYETPATFVVMNNHEYRTLKNTLDADAGVSAKTGRYVGLDLTSPALDFSAVARAFGMAFAKAGSADELHGIVAGAGSRDAPLLVEVPITSHQPPAHDDAFRAAR